MPTIAWYDPSDVASITATGSNITAVADKSGNGNGLTASGSTNYQTGTHTINGLNVLACPGTGNGILKSGNITVAQPITALMVVQATTLTPNALQEALGNPNVGGGPLIAAAISGIKWWYYAGAVQSSAGDADLAAHVIDAIFNGASSQFDLDRASLSTASPGTRGWVAAPICIGTDFQQGNVWKGYIGEVLLYASALSPTNLLAAQNYLKTKWATP